MKDLKEAYEKGAENELGLFAFQVNIRSDG